MDTYKIAPGLYQYTAVDDYTRYRFYGCTRAVLRLIHWIFWIVS